MKRRLVVLLIMLGCMPLYSFIGDITIHAGFGNALFLDELWTKVPKQSVNKGGEYLELKCMYAVSEKISFGILTGYMQVCSASVDTGFFQIEITAQDIPIIAFMQGYHGSIYFMTGIGIHAWNGDKGGIDRGVLVGGGYETSITSWLNFDLSVKMHLVFSDTTARMFTVTAGLSYVL